MIPKYGLLGGRLKHSLSPQIHKILCGYEYALYEMPEENVEYFMKKADFSAINVTIAGSKSPLLVPIIKPSNGVRPIEVSTDSPFFTAVIEAPFPKWQTIIFKSFLSLPRICAALLETKSWLVPWNPYLLTLYL